MRTGRYSICYSPSSDRTALSALHVGRLQQLVQPRQPATNHDSTHPNNNSFPNRQQPLSQLHQQDWRRDHAKVFTNIVTLLQGETHADILLLQGWGCLPGTGCPPGNNAPALGPQTIARPSQVPRTGPPLIWTGTTHCPSIVFGNQVSRMTTTSS